VFWSFAIMNSSVKWAAELAHVREVSLLGTADLAYWKDRLLEEGLLPAESDGRAQLLIIAADSKFMRVRFRELSFCVLVSRQDHGIRQDAAYLVRAFNSCRFFAFCERVFFSTPYYHGDVRVSASLPTSVHLVKNGEVVFAAEMGADPSGRGREPSRCGDDGWDGPVFLPKGGRRGGRQGKVFIARLRGYTRIYAFLPDTDSVAIRPSPDSEVLQALNDSQFVAREWIIREDATHAKSKTYRRADLLPDETCAAPAAAPVRLMEFNVSPVEQRPMSFIARMISIRSRARSHVGAQARSQQEVRRVRCCEVCSSSEVSGRG
jgi:hypothetical protein